MVIEKYFDKNRKKLKKVSDDALKVAFSKCREHIRLRIKKKTLYGAHTTSNLGEDPIVYYLEDAIDAIISGRWEWKDKFDLTTQLIRIINSKISKEVEKIKTDKAQALNIQFIDLESELYKFDSNNDLNELEQKEKYEKQVKLIEKVIEGNTDLEFLFECIKEGYKRREIAELMNIEPKRVDKLLEKLKNKAINQKAN